MSNAPRFLTDTGASSAVARAALYLACLGLVALGQFIAHVRTDEMDPWLFAYIGRELLNGDRLYADLWDIKAPGILWINAIGLKLGGGSLAGVWALCILASVATVALFYRVASKLYGWQIASAATLIAALFLNFYPFHMGGNRPATFYVLTELAAVAAYLGGLRSPHYRSLPFIASGAISGIGFCIKQTTVAALVGITIHMLYSYVAGETTRRVAVRRFVWLTTGWLAAVGAAIGALAATSDLGWAWDAVFRFSLNEFAAGGSATVIPSVGWVGRHLRGMSLPLILAGGAVAYEFWVRVVLKRGGLSRHPLPCGRGFVDYDDADNAGVERPHGLILLLCAWLVVAVYAGTIDPQQRLWHLAISLPPLMLLSAHGVSLLIALCKNRIEHRGGSILFAIAATVGFAWLLVLPVRMQLDMAGRQKRRAFDRPPNPVTEQLVQAIRAHSQPNDTIFCFVYMPDIYWRVNRPPAVRYITAVSANGWDNLHNPLMNTIADDIERAPPKIIVYTPGNSTLPRAQSFDRWLAETYTQPETETLPDLWVRVAPDIRD